MGSAVSTLIAQVRDEFVFDASDDQILRWLNSKYRSMVVDAEFLSKTVALAATDGGDSLAVPASVVRVRALTIDGESWVRAGDEAACESAGTFSPAADENGASYLLLDPVPDAGLAASMFASVRPDALTLDGVVVTPEEYDEALVNGTAAIGFRRDAEQAGVADELDALFLAAVEKLRRQTRRLTRSGPKKIRVAWP